MDNLPTLMSEIRSKYADDVPLEVLEAYCRRYLHYYHRHIEQQPARFYGAWGWSEARRREFRKAFDASRRQIATGSGMQHRAVNSGGRQDGT
jgi:hypothetical protein